jgi:hypothetical protein
MSRTGDPLIRLRHLLPVRGEKGLDFYCLPNMSGGASSKELRRLRAPSDGASLDLTTIALHELDVELMEVVDAVFARG